MRKILDSLDHPVMFVFFTSLAVAGMLCILQWSAKAANQPGLAHALGG